MDDFQRIGGSHQTWESNESGYKRDRRDERLDLLGVEIAGPEDSGVEAGGAPQVADADTLLAGQEPAGAEAGGD